MAASTDTTGRKGLRGHFSRREAPYAGADLERSAKLAAGMRVFGALLACIALPMAPPDRIGALGWVIAGTLIVASVISAGRTALASASVSHDELLLYSYVTLGGVATIEFLAGGRSSPYHQIFMLTVFNVALAHPPRRFAFFVPFYLGAVAAPFLYGPSDAAQVADAAVQVLITLGAALVGSVLMQSVRDQRVDLESQGAADRHAAETDALTGLGNRRALIAELEARAPQANTDRPLMLALFDLDGFKAYNDAFGHPAGDAVLVRLAGRLRAVLRSQGRAYRMGGDEFCVLAEVTPAEALDLVEAASMALSDEGDGFQIGASRGTVLLPSETDDPHEALRIADTRMYARKSLGRTSAGRQSADVLLSLLAERDPGEGEHIDGVADMCVAVGRELGMDEGELPHLRSAGALHDIGKLAIPEAILSKPGPLTEDEWEFVRRHPVIGERILRAAPALAPVAPLVRSAREHFDGSGYPDAYAGEQIPLASRIVAVCDAFDAMVSERPYRAAMSENEAMAELHACAGTQFDPMVVSAYDRVRRGVSAPWSEMRQA
jgi:two-component system cell cycle response regulator